MEILKNKENIGECLIESDKAVIHTEKNKMLTFVVGCSFAEAFSNKRCLVFLKNEPEIKLIGSFLLAALLQHLQER